MVNKNKSVFRKPFVGTTNLSRILNKRYSTILIVLLLAFLFTIFFRSKFFTEHEVRVTRAIAFPYSVEKLAEGNFSTSKKGELLFQASGWLEPDPFPVKVTSLYSGVVEEVHVLEGQKVAKGQIIASLIDEDARLAVSETNAQLSQSISEEAIIEADIELAKAGLEAAVSEIRQNEVLLEEKNDSVNRMVSLPVGAVADQIIYQTKLALQRQRAVLATSNSEVKQRKAMIKKLEETLIAQKKKTDIFTVQKQRAELDLKRTKIKSPINGIVLRLLAKPGSRMMLHMDDMDAAAAAIIFEEGKLQARIDVPLSEAAKINLGQTVEVSSSILPEKKFIGQISRILGEADLQRNTLQVKVSLLNPHPRLRPEMLCRAKFFGENSQSPEDFSSLKVFVNKKVISNNLSLDNREGDLWVISKDGKTCVKRTVSFGKTKHEEFLEVKKGLLAGEQVILNPASDLRIGDRVKIIDIL